MDIVSTAVRILILAFVLIAGAITFAGTNTSLRSTEPAATEKSKEEKSKEKEQRGVYLSARDEKTAEARVAR